MRHRVLLISLTAAAFASTVSIVLRLVLDPAEHPRMKSRDLALSFLQNSDGMPVLQVTNQSKFHIVLAHSYVEIEVRNPTNGSVFSGDQVFYVNSPLAPASFFRVPVVAPTNGLRWRATLMAFDGTDYHRKQALGRSWIGHHAPSWVLRPFTKWRVTHADTAWIAP